MRRVCKKSGQFILIFMLCMGWILSGWPQIWHNPTFPPRIEKVQAAGWLTGWRFRNKITISNTNVGAVDLSNFPLLVKIAESGGSSNNIGANLSDTVHGYDVRFTDTDGTTLLPYERAYFSVASNNLTANFWTRVTTVSHSAPTDIYVYYGNVSQSGSDWTAATSVISNCTIITNEQCTWKDGASQNYAGVWHLDESAGSNYDSSANAKTANVNGTPTSITGPVGNAKNYSGNSDNSAISSISLSGLSYVIEGWFYYPLVASPSGWRTLTRGSSDHQLLLDSSDYLGSYDNAGGTTWKSSGYNFSGLSTGWHYLALRADNAAPSSTFYVDGVQVGSSLNWKSNADIGYFGAYQGGSQQWGKLDEFRISTSLRSVDWIKFEFYNQGSGTNEITINTTESVAGSSYYWVPGGNGNWSSSTNWASSSGGSAGAGVPGFADNVVFDNNSGTGVSAVDSGFTGLVTNLTTGSGGTSFGGTIAFGEALGVSGNLTLATGTIDPSTYLLSIGGTFSVTGTINVGATTFAGNYSKTATLNTGSTVNYKSASATTVLGTTYYNLTVNHAGTTFTLGGPITVNGNLTVTAGTLDTGAAISDGTGGVITHDGSYTVHTFNSGGTFTPPAGVSSVAVLVVAGGGGGGAFSGGGGAGGLIYNSSYAVTNQVYTVTVGDGGNGGVTSDAGNNGTNGSNSVFGTITATGGGGGGARTNIYGGKPGNDGGSGGGGAPADSGILGTGGNASPAGQGNKGGDELSYGWGGGGGGGAGVAGGTASGNDAGSGGNGLAYSISGSSLYYAGGGGGGTYSGGAGSIGNGGNGGGGAGGKAGGGVAGTANTGGGGGGSGYQSTGGKGGSGVVIVRYATSAGNNSITLGGNFSNSGTFNANSGTVTLNGSGAQLISGANTFYGLVITGGDRTVSFQSTVAQTIASGGTLTLNGTSGHILTLAPITAASAWKLNVSTTGVTQSISYVSVSYSDATGIANFNTTVNGLGTQVNDGGHNTNWNFGVVTPVYSISITSSGMISYGYVQLNSSTTTVNNGFTQIATNDGNSTEKLNVKSSDATNGVTWLLASVIGSNQYKHEFSTTTGSSWTTMPDSSTYVTAVPSIVSSGNANFDFKLTAPSASDYQQKSITITIQAVAP